MNRIHAIAKPTRKTPVTIFAQHHYLERNKKGKPLTAKHKRQTMAAVNSFIFHIGDNLALGDITETTLSEWANRLEKTEKWRLPHVRSVLIFATKCGLCKIKRPLRKTTPATVIVATVPTSPATSDTKLTEFAKNYYVDPRRGRVTEHHLYCVMSAVRNFVRWHRKDPRLGDINAELITRWESDPKARSKNHAAYLGCVLHAAHDAEIGGVPRPQKKEYKPRATKRNGQPFLTEEPETLWWWCKQRYFPVNLKIRSENSRRQYRFALENFAEFLGRPPVLADLTDDNVAGVMNMLLGQNKSPATVNDRRIRINALWTFLCKKEKVKVWPFNHSVDEPEPDPQAWTREEMKRLVAAADVFVDDHDRKNLATWWHALFAVAWNSGARTGELLKMRWEWIDWTTGNIRVPSSVRKGKRKAAIYRLKAATLDKLRKLGLKETGIIFECGSPHAYYCRYRKLLERAGIPQNRKNGLQRWRRSFATYIELAGGDATKELMHDDRGTTKRSYLDKGMLYKPQNDLLFELGSLADVESGERSKEIAREVVLTHVATAPPQITCDNKDNNQERDDVFGTTDIMLWI